MTKQKLRLRTKSTDPAYGGGAGMLTPSVDSSHEGSPPLPIRNESNMENVIWINSDGSQELWVCDNGMLKGIIKGSIMLTAIWGHALAVSKENQTYWPHQPLPGRNKEERNEDRN